MDSNPSNQGPRRTRRTRIQAKFDEQRGVFMISVAAELAEMHPQTLRMYEARGLITPQRSAKNTRLYSQADVDRLRRIQQMTAEQGLNLAGVETVLRLEGELERMSKELDEVRLRANQIESDMIAEVDRAKQALRGEIVPYRKYETAVSEPAVGDQPRPVQIPVQRTPKP